MRTPRWLFPVVVTTLATVLAVSVAGCARTAGGAGSAQSGPPTGQPVTGPVVIVRTGGLAGVNQKVEVSSDGAWSYTDQRSGATQKGQLTQAERDQLSTLASDGRVAAELAAAANPGSCADVFHYTLTLGSRTLAFDECDRTPRPALQAIITAITASTAF